MKEKHTQKKQTEITSNITPLVITGNDRLVPYIQVFMHHPENISQHALGTLFGVFKIDDISVDSAFVVNFLVSELKKEYYGNPRRTPAGSFEAGLNRINIALSELAKQGNIAWIGKLESALCALEKNGMMHFSVTGSSHIALMREGSLSLVSEGLAPDTLAPNPLKTFLEISSGKLHPEDLIILGTHELFEFLPKEKMERNAKHFPYEEFTRFLHTALVNEFDLCGAITISLNKKSNQEKVHTQNSSSAISPESIPNMFSASAFRKHNPKKNTSEEIREQENRKPEQGQDREGHLYIQQQSSSTRNSHQEMRETLLILKEHLANILDERFVLLQNALRQWRRAFSEKREKRKEETQRLEYLKSPQPQTEEIPLITRHDQRIAPPQKITFSPPTEKEVFSTPTQPSSLPAKEYFSSPDKNKKHFSFSKILGDISRSKYTTLLQEKTKTFSQYLLSKGSQCFSSTFRSASSLLYFLKNRFLSLPKKWKITVLGGVFLGIFALLLFFIFQKQTQPETKDEESPSPETPVQEAENPLLEEKNISFAKAESLITLYSSQNTIRQLFALNGNTLLVLENQSVILIPEKEPLQTFPFPEGNNQAVSATYMNDLSLLLILTEKGNILSFSPLSKKFSENNLILDPSSLDHLLLGSYLTYLYVADTQKNTILRYPRAEGGFGSPDTWLSESSGISLAGATSFAIDGSLYLSKPDSVLRLSKKKEDPLTLEKTSVSAQFGSITTRSVDDSLLLSDTISDRALFFKKDGSLEKQILFPEQTPTIQNIIALNNNTLIIQTEKEILRLGE